ncbi:NAD(+)/NADH kinase [Gemmatimonadales bacterium]|jgi:NAD+ kinase|nr:NAD(+)/NADH kinase [Gemmatimonadales bacterium]
MNVWKSFKGPFLRFGVVYREHTPEVLSIIKRLRTWCETEGIQLVVEEAGEKEGPRELDVVTEAFDLIVALGGDGTFLRASRLVVGTPTPVLGINLGRLGFLTAIPFDALEEGLSEIVAGRAVIEPRFRLRAMIQSRSEEDSDVFFALNDIVVHTTGAARITPLSLDVSDRDGRMQEVGSFSADGLIISTPTGSTAYSMSAGGPIIGPEVEAIVVTPICPHSLSVRPIVLPSTVTISVGSLDSGGYHQVTVDGQVVRRLAPGDRVVVAREAVPLSLIRLPEQSFFDTLRRKLNWANRVPDGA